MLQKAGARMGALWISRSTRKAQRIRTATGYRKPNLHTVAAHGVAPSAMFEPLREARLNKNSGVAPDAVRAMLEGFSSYAVQVCRLHDASACILGVTRWELNPARLRASSASSHVSRTQTLARGTQTGGFSLRVRHTMRFAQPSKI